MGQRNKDTNQRIRELEAELERQRIAREAEHAHFHAELTAVRQQATVKRAPATVFLGRLTQSEVNTKIRKREVGTFADGGNLQLAIRYGAKPDSEVIASWLFRWTETLRPGAYKGQSMGLGSARLVSLEDARRKAHHFRELLADGKDPKAERLAMIEVEQSAKNRARTLEQVGQEYIEKKVSKRSVGYKKRLWQTLTDNVLTKLYRVGDRDTKVGSLPIQRVTREIILKDCGFEQLWSSQYPTARDLRSLLDGMFSYAREHGYFVGNSPMAWRGGLEHILSAPRDTHTVAHHKAMTYESAPVFLQQHLRNHRYRRSWPNGIAPNGRTLPSLMIELALLTGARVGEIIGAEWGEIDRVTATWTVPGERTKRKEQDHPHRMPITASMMHIFRTMEEMCTDPSPQGGPIFPSLHKKWVLSHNRVGSQTLGRIVKQLQPEGGEKFVTHGFRSTLKNWCRANGYSEAWYEAQLHHKEVGKVKQAYGGDDLLEQRRAMMSAWDAYLTAPLQAGDSAANNVVNLPRNKKRKTG